MGNPAVDAAAAQAAFVHFAIWLGIGLAAAIIAIVAIALFWPAKR